MQRTCYHCGITRTHKKGDIPWSIIGFDIANDEPYFLCPECSGKFPIINKHSQVDKLNQETNNPASIPVDIPVDNKPEISYREI